MEREENMYYPLTREVYMRMMYIPTDTVNQRLQYPVAEELL